MERSVVEWRSDLTRFGEIWSGRTWSSKMMERLTRKYKILET